ncbi:grasp-with-spasm system ATP-grasp peptide maturase [Sphingobacterium detergens]|uniref:ATP-GRASP peptide maturase of grasp-with-spasm system n=1 Tax=Sphingobacterium detergens TaxID=1145106 RepID=A0A420BKF7_SPHD1|nr:grasp-with-spasm system ATP-grasp peptide maturase [Sphingobacterium detergens]RKE57189.1 ATP-GRASP peptide maturase of grasp-with-spasm system [Sphingobacterium detergens]
MSIAIVSTDGDQSTFNVIDWIHFYKGEALLLTNTEKICLNKIEVSKGNKMSFAYGNEQINLDKIESFWHRRGNFSIQSYNQVFSNDFPFFAELTQHLSLEERKLKEFIAYQLKSKRHLGNIFKSSLNKLIVLEEAQNLNIIIPKTLITNQKRELQAFRLKFGQVICKSISEAFTAHKIDIGILSLYTSIITDENMDQLDASFPLTLFQEKIEKKYELRIFFIENRFYTMAIFSQNDKKTSVDFRKYNFIKPNRTVPFKLPKHIEKKLIKLMKKLDLNTGSIDMAVTPNQEYVFFEVNPIGQFGMTSYPCNYHLDKVIAEFLLNKNKTDEQA